MNLKGSKTEANLLAAFSGESQARNKYTYFAEKAKKDGYVQISRTFEKIADNEKEHAKIWLHLLCEGERATKENLCDAADGENYEWTKMYKEFAQTAKEEGFDRISALFEMVANIEQQHEECFRLLISKLENDLVFSSDSDVMWICSNCGHVHYGKNAPQICPVCSHPQAYFEIKAENY